MPIFFSLPHIKRPFLAGYLWGVWFYFLHSSTFFILIAREGQQGLLFFLSPFLFITYAAIYSGIWFYCLQKIACLERLEQNIVHLLSASLVSLLYFYCIDTYLLWPFGQLEGYPLVFPLLSLAADYFSIKFLYLLPVLGKWVLLWCVIIAQALFVYLVKHKKRAHWYGLIVFLLMPFFVGFVLPDGFLENKKYLITQQQDFLSNQQINNLLDRLVVIVPSNSAHQTAYQCAKELCQKMEQAVLVYPEVEIFCAPESAFPFCLHEHKKLLSLWDQNILKDEKFFFCGAHQIEKGNVYNTIVLIHKSRIIQTYVKLKLIPFFERKVALPATFNFLNDLFLKDKNDFKKLYIKEKEGTLHAPTPFLNNYTVVICSELFTNAPDSALKIRLIFMKLNRFNSTPWQLLIKHAINFKLILDDFPSLIISDEPFLYFQGISYKIKKIS